MPTTPAALTAWHRIVEARDPAMLAELLAEDVVFRSPAVFAAQHGRAITTRYLSAALDVLGPTLRYQHEWFDESSAVLEFEADLDGVLVHGIDLLRWNAASLITSFTVFARPVRGLQELMTRMAPRLGIS